VVFHFVNENLIVLEEPTVAAAKYNEQIVTVAAPVYEANISDLAD
jgi:hypothetical protein